MYINMRAKYNGNCQYQDITNCGGIRRGENITHVSNGNTFHYNCAYASYLTPAESGLPEFNESQDQQNWDSMQADAYYTNIETKLGA